MPDITQKPSGFAVRREAEAQNPQAAQFAKIRNFSVTFIKALFTIILQALDNVLTKILIFFKCLRRFQKRVTREASFPPAGGQIQPGYRGEIFCMFVSCGHRQFSYWTHFLLPQKTGLFGAPRRQPAVAALQPPRPFGAAILRAPYNPLRGRQEDKFSRGPAFFTLGISPWPRFSTLKFPGFQLK